MQLLLSLWAGSPRAPDLMGPSAGMKSTVPCLGVWDWHGPVWIALCVNLYTRMTSALASIFCPSFFFTWYRGLGAGAMLRYMPSPLMPKNWCHESLSIESFLGTVSHSDAGALCTDAEVLSLGSARLCSVGRRADSVSKNLNLWLPSFWVLGRKPLQILQC